MKRKILALPLLGLTLITLGSCSFLNGGSKTTTQTEQSSSSTSVSNTTTTPTTSQASTTTSQNSSSSTNTNTSTSTSTATTTSTRTTTTTTTTTSIPTTTTSSTTRTSTSTSTSTTTTSTTTKTSTSTSTSTNTSTPEDNHGINITEVAGYGEAAYAKFVAQSGQQYNAYYKKSTDSNYTQIDSELVRVNGDSGRVDVLGLSSGTYTIKIEKKNATSTYTISSSFNVMKQDRSGYAHHNYTSGVGAYKDDGTLKDNAVVVYVTESNKNTVTAKIGSNTYTGLSNILQHATNESYPVNIRIIGTVGAATWNKIDYNKNKTYNSQNLMPISVVKGINNEQLPTSSKNIDESTIIDGGYNTLDESTYSKLNGLTNKIIYSSGEYDSYYNMLDISGAKNVTVEGVGVDACINQWGFTWKSSNSIEVKNLTFNDYPEDACSFEGSGKDYDLTTISAFTSTNYWVHNNTFNIGSNPWDVCPEQDKHEGDGATDLKRCAFVTFSYNEYYKTHKTGLVGGGDNQMTSSITFHHNYYNQCQARLPFARQANIHMYNNYYYKSSGNNMQIYAGAYAFIENCYFSDINKTFIISNEYFKTPAEGTVKSGVTYYRKDDSTYTPVSLTIGTQFDKDSKIDGVVYYEKRTPAIKSVNNLFSNCNNLSNVSNVSRTQTVTNGNAFGSTFDTNSSIFYYNSANQKSKVSVMHETSEIPTLIPSLAGAGKLKGYIDDSNSSQGSTEPVSPTTYSTVLNETFTVSKSATKTDSIPTSSGLYYHIADQESSASLDADSTNYVNVSNNVLNIHDESTETTTWGYYVLSNTYASGITKYTVKFTPIKQSGSWSPIIFSGTSTNVMLRSDSDKYWGYSTDGTNTTTMLSSAYTANAEYTIILIVDYDNNTVKLSINGTESTVSGVTPYEVKYIKFMTAKSDNKRSFTVSNIKIETSN